MAILALSEMEGKALSSIARPTQGEHNRQCTYNVTLRRFRTTNVAVEKQ